MNKFYASKGFLLFCSLGFTVFATTDIAHAEFRHPGNFNHVTTPVKKDQTVTFGSIANQVYGTKLSLKASASSGLPITFEVLSGPALIEGDILRIMGTGQVTVSASQDGNESYNARKVVRSFKALRKKITVVGNPISKVYGDADPVLSYIVKPGLVEGDVFTGALSREAGEHVGRYLINLGTLDIKDCYDVDCEMDFLDIFSKTIEVTANPMSKVYGSADPVLTYSFTPALIAGDAFQGQLSRSPGELRGLYPISLNTLKLSSDYFLAFKSAMFEVIKPVVPLPLLKANNIITPNGDGKNDFLVFDDLGEYPENELKVFDRASRILYLKKGYDNSFDAKVNGSTLTEGSYYYIIDFGPGKLKLKGFFNVILDK
ncbi:MAG: polymorphic outer membrane protein [Pedobacter sp.]|jgi:gliding motility-associated-like protein|nr:polymorphic outer membrane protein [Pedobacter sp.]